MKVTAGGKTYDIEPGYVLMEWVGESSPLDQEWVRYSLAMNRFTAQQAELIREVARACCHRVDYAHRRIMRRGREDHGGIPDLSVESITWGPYPDRGAGAPGSYIQIVSNHDADLILATPSGLEFVVYTEDGETHRGDDQQLILTPDINVRLTSPQVVARVAG